MECVEREGEGQWLVQVEGSDSKQLEMKVQCEQFISTFDPPLHTPSRLICMHSFVTRASCMWSQNVGVGQLNRRRCILISE